MTLFCMFSQQDKAITEEQVKLVKKQQWKIEKLERVRSLIFYYESSDIRVHIVLQLSMSCRKTEEEAHEKSQNAFLCM